MNDRKKGVKSLRSYFINFLGMTIGAFLAALSIRIFLYPNQLIDGGIVGISLISARLLGDSYLSFFLILFNLPFIYLAYKFIRRSFVIQMLIAVIIYAAFLSLLHNLPVFRAEPLEVIVMGGAILGTGIGMIIRNGSCIDGSEIMAIIINRKTGFTVGQIVLAVNILIFSGYGLIFLDWHIAIRSLLTYIVAFKMIDIVIAGLDEVKSVLIMTTKPQMIKKLVMHELGLGLTIIPAVGGFSGKGKDILFVIIERLDLAALKELVLREDPYAFMAIENLHEVAYGRQVSPSLRKKIKHKKSLLKG